MSVGEPHELMYEMTEIVCNVLPEDKPRYLMGVGTPTNLLENIALGVDMFDCVMPTRKEWHDIYWRGMSILKIKWADDFSPVDENGTSYVDSKYSKAYVRHLFTVNEN